VVAEPIIPQAKSPSSLPAGRQAGLKNGLFEKYAKSYPQADNEIYATKK
jgi:hypothetical protein